VCKDKKKRVVNGVEENITESTSVASEAEG